MKNFETTALAARLSRWQPQALGVLRIVVGLLFTQAGLQVLFHVPELPGPIPPGMETLMLVAGTFELVGGLLVLIGLLTRPAAFILSGMMAVAYWGFHAPSGFFPTNNMGVPAILYCFIFLYLVFAGPGAWSIDGR